LTAKQHRVIYQKIVTERFPTAKRTDNGFGATQQLGETTGIYMGYSVDTGRNVYLQPSLASQGVKGTVTNALASAFVGSLGGGKSFCNNLLVYYAVSSRINRIAHIDTRSFS